MNDSFITILDIDDNAVRERLKEPSTNLECMFMRCPACDTIVLIDWEEHRMYVDPNNIFDRFIMEPRLDDIACPGCSTMFEPDNFIVADKPEISPWHVPRSLILASDWAWAIYPIRRSLVTSLAAPIKPE
ncbi:MAG: endo alpha-1,4 polygalactosaminidase [Chloroflexi bacterium]|nr:endo alpha-1,4 polygalactosaminidase [Chloroflexota bacterium]